jgi:hypothetical protein
MWGYEVGVNSVMFNPCAIPYIMSQVEESYVAMV